MSDRPSDDGQQEPVAGLFVGLTTLDLSHRVRELPGPNQKIQASGQAVAAGGPAANAAVAFASQGGRPRLVTGIGAHPLGALVVGDLEEHGVEVLDCDPLDVEPPSVSSIMVGPTGDRAVVSLSSARRWLLAPPDIDDWVAESSVVLCDGHHAELARAAVRAAGRHRVPVVLDGGSWKPVLPGLLSGIAVAAVSADFRPPDLRPGQDLLAYLLGRGADFAAVTDGPHPIRWATWGASGSVRVPAVVAVDTTAAGDVFHGVLSWYVGRSGTSTDALVAALERAAAAASQFVTSFGTRPR